MKKPWKYVDNQFTVSTKKSFKKALKLSIFHDAALLAQQGAHPALAPLYTRYHTLHLAYALAYTAWRSAGGAQEGETLNLKQLLETSYTNVDGWDAQIQVVHPKSSARYRAIFPDGRKPFSVGGIDQRIDAYSTLASNIGNEVALAAVKQLVDDVYSALDTARVQQAGAKTGRRANSTQLDRARIDIMDMQYRDMAVVLDAFYDEREGMCNRLFDLETLRNPEQQTFTVTLSPDETHNVATRTLLSDDVLRAKLNGPGTVTIFLATTAGGTDSHGVNLTTDEVKTFEASAFGVTDYGTHRHLTAVNASGAVTKLTLTV
jgi:hypothetical protein